MISDQATPISIVNGHVVTILLSDRPPKRSIAGNEPFFDPKYSISGHLLCDTISRLEAWQSGMNLWESKSFVGEIPFVNVLPWISRNVEAEGLRSGFTQLNCYLNTTKPLITIVLSKDTTIGLFSQHYKSSESFVGSMVGIPKRVFILDEHESDCNFSTIIIPHVHPGADKYTARSRRSYRAVFNLTWQITLYVLQIATNVAFHADANVSREEVIDYIFSLCSPGSL